MQTGADRRGSGRNPCQLGGHCLFPADRDCVHWPVTVRDISAEGIGWTVECCFEPGTIVSLQVRNEVRAVTMNKSVEVRHVRREESDGWRLGGTFITSLSDEELVALL